MSRACRGLRSPAAWRPIATPYGVGLKAGSSPTISTGRRSWNWPAAWASSTCSPTERPSSGPVRGNGGGRAETQKGRTHMFRRGRWWPCLRRPPPYRRGLASCADRLVHRSRSLSGAHSKRDAVSDWSLWPRPSNLALEGKVRPLEQPQRLGLRLACPSLGGPSLPAPGLKPGRGSGSLVSRVLGCVSPPGEARTPRKERGGKDHRAPNHISKMVLSTVKSGPPEGTRT